MQTTTHQQTRTVCTLGQIKHLYRELGIDETEAIATLLSLAREGHVRIVGAHAGPLARVAGDRLVWN